MHACKQAIEGLGQHFERFYGSSTLRISGIGILRRQYISIAQPSRFRSIRPSRRDHDPETSLQQARSSEIWSTASIIIAAIVPQASSMRQLHGNVITCTITQISRTGQCPGLVTVPRKEFACLPLEEWAANFLCCPSQLSHILPYLHLILRMCFALRSSYAG